MITRSTVPSDLSRILRSGSSRSSGPRSSRAWQHRAIGGVKRLEDFADDRLGDFVGAAGDRELRLFVVQPRRRADHHAMEGVRALAAVGADHHAHRQRRAVFVRAQRAQIVGDALRQHRHDAVGKIDRIAALERGAIERRARPHIMRDVGDGDADDMAAAIARVGIGHRHARRRRDPWRRADRW